MSLTSVPPPPSAIDGPCRDKRSEAVYLGRRRVSLMVAALCLLLVWGRGRHPNYLLAQGEGDHAAGIAILGNALLLGGVAFAAATAMMSVVLLLCTWRESCRLPGFRRVGLVVGAGGLALALLGIPTSLRLSREFVASSRGCEGNDPDTRIQGCTALLDSVAGSRSAALLNRGRAYVAKGQYDLAIVDLNGAIALAPGSADGTFGGHEFRPPIEDLTNVELGGLRRRVQGLPHAIPRLSSTVGLWVCSIPLKAFKAISGIESEGLSPANQI